MQVTRKQDGTNVTLTISASEAYLAPIKTQTLTRLAHKAKLTGFREGKAPLNLVEKNLDPQLLQSEFVDDALNVLYPNAAQQQKLRPVDRPKITLKKFVPFTQFEFDAEVEVIGKINLPDYKQFKLSKEAVSVTEKDVTEVLNSLKIRMADKKEVKRAAKDGDEVLIDFSGVDDKKQPVQGADGKDYPLLLGSKTFIPGFEENVIGMKPGDKKEFTLKFPKDYHVAALANRNVTFKVIAQKVQEVIEPKLDDELAKKTGQFKTLSELKGDIKKQLKHEKEQDAERKFENDLIAILAEKTKVDVPSVLIDDQIERDLTKIKQNLAYRGQTYDEFLKIEGKTDEAYRTEMAPEAERRVKASLALAEVAEVENLQVTPDELDVRLQILKGQYQDAAMQAELDKPEARSDIASRILTEKTIAKLAQYATKK